ncbi:MAG TPA: cobalamin-binding protein [Woeseiaceae bacterium]
MRRTPAGVLLAIGILALAGACDRPGGEPPEAAAPGPAAGLRIVTLAPHLAELVFAVGAGDVLVGVSAYTDRPPEAAALPVVGDAFSLDQERIAMLRPDLLLAWGGGMPARVIEDLRARGFRVEIIETRGLGDVATALERIGELTGHVREAGRVAAEYRADLARLAAEHAAAAPIRVFYQVSVEPLYTVNGAHYASELIESCGGHNVFDDLGRLAPMVDVEAVLARDPEVMLASADNPPDVFDVWKRWPELAAARYDNFFFLPAGDLARPTPRLVAAGARLCAVLDQARARRALIEK